MSATVHQIPRPKTYYGRRLLEHGPLTPREFREITGWPSQLCAHVLERLSNTGTAECRDGRWQLSEEHAR